MSCIRCGEDKCGSSAGGSDMCESDQKPCPCYAGEDCRRPHEYEPCGICNYEIHPKDKCRCAECGLR